MMDFYKVVKRIEIPNAIYGMQAKGIDRVEEPFDRIEDMAQFYLDALRDVRPRGPYLLIGYSLGGLVTLEMAQRLRRSGERLRCSPCWTPTRTSDTWESPSKSDCSHG